MLPVLYPGDWLLCRRTRHIRPGDLVIAHIPGKPDMLLVKRATRRTRDGSWWLESENPSAGAVDSNRFGPVPSSAIVGRVLVRYWPVRHLTTLSMPRGPGSARDAGTGPSDGCNPTVWLRPRRVPLSLRAQGPPAPR
jgi:hypothetical protein